MVLKLWPQALANGSQLRYSHAAGAGGSVRHTPFGRRNARPASGWPDSMVPCAPVPMTCSTGASGFRLLIRV